MGGQMKNWPSDRIGEICDQCSKCGAWYVVGDSHKCDKLILSLVRSAEKKLRKEANETFPE
jgi:hypothetical protein